MQQIQNFLIPIHPVHFLKALESSISNSQGSLPMHFSTTQEYHSLFALCLPCCVCAISPPRLLPCLSPLSSVARPLLAGQPLGKTVIDLSFEHTWVTCEACQDPEPRAHLLTTLIIHQGAENELEHITTLVHIQWAKWSNGMWWVDVKESCEEIKPTELSMGCFTGSNTNRESHLEYNWQNLYFKVIIFKLC